MRTLLDQQCTCKPSEERRLYIPGPGADEGAAKKHVPRACSPKANETFDAGPVFVIFDGMTYTGPGLKVLIEPCCLPVPKEKAAADAHRVSG